MGELVRTDLWPPLSLPNPFRISSLLRRNDPFRSSVFPLGNIPPVSWSYCFILDIHDGKLSLILGLIWTLILRFQIMADDEESANARQAPLDWCNRSEEHTPE